MKPPCTAAGVTAVVRRTGGGLQCLVRQTRRVSSTFDIATRHRRLPSCRCLFGRRGASSTAQPGGIPPTLTRSTSFSTPSHQVSPTTHSSLPSRRSPPEEKDKKDAEAEEEHLKANVPITRGPKASPPTPQRSRRPVTLWEKPSYSAEEVEEVVLLPLIVGLVPFSPQAVRVSFVYQALQGSWKELVRTITSVTKMVNTRYQHAQQDQYLQQHERTSTSPLHDSPALDEKIEGSSVFHSQGSPPTRSDTRCRCSIVELAPNTHKSSSTTPPRGGVDLVEMESFRTVEASSQTVVNGSVSKTAEEDDAEVVDIVRQRRRLWWKCWKEVLLSPAPLSSPLSLPSPPTCVRRSVDEAGETPSPPSPLQQPPHRLRDVIRAAVLLHPHPAPSFSSELPYSTSDSSWTDRIPLSVGDVPRLSEAVPAEGLAPAATAEEKGGVERGEFYSNDELAKLQRLWMLVTAVVETTAVSRARRVGAGGAPAPRSTAKGPASSPVESAGCRFASQDFPSQDFSAAVSESAVMAMVYEIPRQIVRERHGTMRNFIQSHMAHSRQHEWLMEHQHQLVHDSATAKKQRHEDEVVGDVTPPMSTPPPPSAPPLSSPHTTAACHYSSHPLLYAGLFLSHDGLYITRAVTRLEAGVMFSVFYEEIPTTPDPMVLAAPSSATPQHLRRCRVSPSEQSPPLGASPPTEHHHRHTGSAPELSDPRASQRRADEDEDDDDDELEEEEPQVRDPRIQLCEEDPLWALPPDSPSPLGSSRRANHGTGGTLHLQGGIPQNFQAAWEAAQQRHLQQQMRERERKRRRALGLSKKSGTGSLNTKKIFQCRPLVEVESLLECSLSPSLDPLGPNDETVPDSTKAAADAVVPDDGPSAGTNIFSPEMLLPVLPSFFVPLHLLGPRLPQGYTPAHVRELFGRMVKHVEMVALPPLSAAATTSRESGVYLRLHEGLRESTERVVHFASPANWSEVFHIHQAPDYRAYRPDPSLINVFKALFMVRVPCDEKERASHRPPSTSSSSAEAARRRETNPTTSPPSSRRRMQWVLHNEWLSLREMMERAPQPVRDALLPLRASHTLLFFAQMQHHFQFTPDKGGFVRLAGNTAALASLRNVRIAMSSPLVSSSSCDPHVKDEKTKVEAEAEGVLEVPEAAVRLGILGPVRVLPGDAPPRGSGWPLPGVMVTGLGRHNSPTPLAVSEVAALLQQHSGCVYVSELESSRTWGGLSAAYEAQQMQRSMRAKKEGEAADAPHTSSPPPPSSPLLRYLVQSASGMARRGSGAPGSSSSLLLSDYTKREILHYYGSLRCFLACHHGEVFSLRVSPLPPPPPPPPPSSSSSEEEEPHGAGSRQGVFSSLSPAIRRRLQEEQQAAEEEVQRRASRSDSTQRAVSNSSSLASASTARGFSRTAARHDEDVEEADFAQQVPAAALLHTSTATISVPLPPPGVLLASGRSLRSVDVHVLDSPNLMVELWSTYEARQASTKAAAAAASGSSFSDGLSGVGSAGGGSPSSVAVAGGRLLSTAALSGLTLEQQLEYAYSIRDRRRIQKLRRQIAQRNDPEAAFTDTEVLFEAFRRYVPPKKHISLRFLLRHLPSSITDFLPSNLTTWLKRFETQGKIQLFEFRYRHHLHVQQPGLPLPDGALRKTFTDDELVRIVAADIQQRHPRPARMSFLYGLLPMGAKEVLRSRHKTLQTFLMKYPEHFIIIAESKSERGSIVRLLNPPPPPSSSSTAAGGVWHESSGAAAGWADGPSEAELQAFEAEEKEMVLKELNDDLKSSMRWN